MSYLSQDTIVAISTPSGPGAIGIIRLSGPNAISIADKVFFGCNLQLCEPNTVHYGKIKDSEGRILDECVATIFKAPRSYTREDVIEFSCHGSPYILQEVMKLILSSDGIRMAEPGEFTQRAYLNGQLDLSQAEAVGDLIASTHASSHRLAMSQLRGGFSTMIRGLRDQLIEFASLLELENDFGEEDVEFANRDQLKTLLTNILSTTTKLEQSYDHGNAMKDGVSVALVGSPNVGKSTLLNVLLNDDKAIVSDIAGTTRDSIEDTVVYDGIKFRFIDTAGLRETVDTIESLGIERTKQHITKAHIVVYLDVVDEAYEDIVERYNSLGVEQHQRSMVVLNKVDTFGHDCHAYDIEEAVSTKLGRIPTLSISAKNMVNTDQLITQLISIVNQDKQNYGDTVVSNIRHLNCITEANASLTQCLNGLDAGVTSDFLAMDIRHANHQLAEIVGEISTDNLLDSIFTNFCIGK